MSLHAFSLEEKLVEIEHLIVESRRPGSPANRRHMILKAIAADLRATMCKPRSLSLGELERCIRKVKDSPRSALGYESNALIGTAHTLIHHWPFVRQALEHFGEETAE